MSNTKQLIEAAYIAMVNNAVSEDRFDLVDELARQYDAELRQLQAA